VTPVVLVQPGELAAIINDIAADPTSHDSGLT